MIQALLLMALAAANSVEQKMTCVDYVDNGPGPGGQLLLMWSRLRTLRLEGLDVYSDGSVLTRIQIRRGGGIRDCRAKVTKERLESFKAEVERSAICSIRTPKRSELDESDSVFLDLGPKQKCHFELTPRAWIQKAPSRALQLAIDRLRSEICGGACPDPERPAHPFELVEDASRVSPAARHLYKKPTDAAPPDAAPPPKPTRKP
jgi:hypothetical protein